VDNGSSIKLTGERAFEDRFIEMVSRVLSVKKGASQADRIVRFVGGYTKFINEKGGCYFSSSICLLLGSGGGILRVLRDSESMSRL
jgi:hypothetical protein